MKNNTALIWNGFTHRWLEENHRMARIGNRIRKLSDIEVNQLAQDPLPGIDKNADANYQVVHTAASGSEADTAEYKSFFTSIRSPSDEIFFVQGECCIHIQGDEDKLNYGATDISATFQPFPPASDIEGRFLLNGFDIVRASEQEAKKFHRMNIHFSNENIDFAKGTFSATINTSLFSTCQSGECWDIFPFGGRAPRGEKNKIRYNIIVSWVFVVGDKNELIFEDKSYTENMSWDNKKHNPSGDTLFMDDFLKSDTIKFPPTHPLMCPAYRSISYHLTKTGKHIYELPNEKSLHMLEFASYLKSSPGSSKHTLEYLMFFKNWKKNMGHHTAYGVAGTANFNIEVCLMHFRHPNTIIKSHEVAGSLRWNTSHAKRRGKDPNSDAATQSHYFNLRP